MQPMSTGLQHDPELAAELEAAFRAELADRIAAMATIVAEIGNGIGETDRSRLHDALVRHAHSLKGAGQIVGRARLVAVAARLEDQLRSGPYDDEETRAAVDAIARLGEELSTGTAGYDEASGAQVNVPIGRDPEVIEPRESAEGSASPPLRVLHVEDGPVNRALVRAIFERSGEPLVRESVLIEAESLEHARALLRAEAVDVVLLDVRLPDGNGLDLARELRNSVRRPRVVVVSASALPVDRDAALAAGAEQFMSKPVDPAKLVATVAALAGARRDHES